MRKTATSSSRASRKRKQPSIYSPLPFQEEKEIMHLQLLSLRKIQQNGEISEDDIDSDDEQGEVEVEEEESCKVQTDTQQYETKWADEIEEIQVNAFNQSSGPTKTLPSHQDVKNFFELLFSKKVWNHICKETNRYAEQQIELNPDPAWKSLGVGELKSWIGCLIAMGLSKQNNIRMYWESPWRVAVVADRFPRDRFLAIKKYLHLADNSAISDSKTPNADRLAKLRPFLNLLLENFRSNYQPGRFLTMDEDMCKFEGRSSMKQYMKAKIIQWGYKIWKV
jgi:hypothetical protein